MKALAFALVLTGAAPVSAQPVVSQDPGTQLQMMMSPDYVQAADKASMQYKACLIDHATALAKNKKIAPDLLIRAARSKCEKEAGTLAMWRSDEVAKHIEDKVLAQLLERN